MGHAWVPYSQLVTNREDERMVNLEVFREMLEKSGFDVHRFAEEASTDIAKRNLYIGVGTDLPSVTLLACVQDWVERTRPGVNIVPLQIRLPCPGMLEIQNVVREFFEDRGVHIRTITAYPEDVDQVNSVFPDHPLRFDSGASPDDPRIRLLRQWTLYHRIKLQEKHPFGAKVLLGTNLDRNLQRIADHLVPENPLDAAGLVGGVRRPGELWDLSIEPTPPQLPVLDTANADWKIGSVVRHRPFLALPVHQIEETAKVFGIDKIAPILSSPPPIYSRLDKVQSMEMLKLVKRCHVRCRAMRKTAMEFIKSNCRLDYKMGWSTLNRAAAKELPDEALQIVVSALAGFSSPTAVSDWIKRPTPALQALLPLIRGSDHLPPSPIVPIEGTDVSMLFGTPYEQKLSVDTEVMSFVCTPRSLPETQEFPEWVEKSDRHPHPPTKCITGTQFGRWLVQLFCSPERREMAEAERRVFYVTRLRTASDSWYRQFTNGHRFQAFLKSEIHDSEMHFKGHPTRPSELLMRDIPLVAVGTQGLAGPSEDGEEVPEFAAPLTIVACPPFGFWTSQMRGHVWQGGKPVISKAAGHILKQQWLLDFLPPPGLLGPLFLPVSKQVSNQVRIAEKIADQTKTRAMFNTGRMSEEQYKRVKATVVSNLMNQSGEASPDKVFKSVHDGLKKKGTLRIPSTEPETHMIDNEEVTVQYVEAPPDAGTVELPTQEEIELFRAIEDKKLSEEEAGEVQMSRKRASIKATAAGWQSVHRTESDTSTLADFIEAVPSRKARTSTAFAPKTAVWKTRQEEAVEEQAKTHPVYTDE
eukprot:TRINITY_DN58280_c0_g1_i1.p2 TRINITY_DN58280_c0_g1~~TRINITY_DN58280_c0_g1_i1.p2  ORF type:complete len:842 (+),score=283.47 TRINITY_DN58280_c0_g1_i1:98-2527(+)